jgi:hypothetical protein
MRFGPIWASGRVGSLRWPRSIIGIYILAVLLLAGFGTVPVTLLVWSLWIGIPLLIVLGIIARVRAKAART